MSKKGAESDWKQKYKIWQPLLLSSMIVVGMYIGFKMDDNLHSLKVIDNQDSTSYIKPGKLDELVRFVDAKYVDHVNQEELTQVAINAILEKLDPHSAYFDGRRLKDLKEKMRGAFKGIGVRVYRYQDSVRVIYVNEEGPAMTAGVLKNDIILKINDTLVSNSTRTLPEITDLIKNSEQDDIVLELLRDGKPQVVNIQKEAIPLRSVNRGFMLDDQTGFIKIIRFSSNTYREFMEELERMVEKESLKNLVIDVRGNPGGYLNEAVNILSQLIPEKDKLLVYTEGRTVRKNEYKSTGRNFFQIDKVSVLIDEGSASGSEILAGAIQDLDRGIILGRRSFGKGLVQEQYELSDGSAIRLTIARYYTPSGRLIQRDYADMDAYDSEYLRRYDSGELFHKDSMKIVNDSVYKTSEGRNVYGGGGIQPDIFIPIESYAFNDAYMDLMEKTEKFAFSLYLKHTETINDEAEFQNLYSDNYLSSNFLASIVEENLINEFSSNTKVKERVTHQIKERLAGFHFSLSAEEKERAKIDPCITESLKAFAKGATLSAMLQNN